MRILETIYFSQYYELKKGGKYPQLSDEVQQKTIKQSLFIFLFSFVLFLILVFIS